MILFFSKSANLADPHREKVYFVSSQVHDIMLRGLSKMQDIVLGAEENFEVHIPRNLNLDIGQGCNNKSTLLCLAGARVSSGSSGAACIRWETVKSSKSSIRTP